MRREVNDFFLIHKIPINRMVRVGINKGLEKQSIIDAAEKLYDEVKNGLEIDPIRIAWEVYARASSTRLDVNPASLSAVMNAVEKSEEKMITELREIRAAMKEYETPWYKRLWRKINERGTK